MRKLAGDGGGLEWCAVPGGEVLANLSDHVGRSAFFAGDLDRKITWICKQIVRPGDTVLDIGANIGMVTVLMADLVGKGGLVHSFEPNPRLVDHIEKAIQRNRLQNVRLHAIGLGASEQELELLVPEWNQGAGTLVPNRDAVDEASNVTRHTVRVDSLDRLFSGAEVSHVRLLKIDVEGFEDEVFAGAQRFMTENQPDAVLFELNERTAEKFQDEPLIKRLQSLDYEILAIPKSLFRMKLIKLDSSMSNAGNAHDFVAAPRGVVFDQIAKLMRAD